MYSEDDRQYLQMMQGNIERMAANSANVKTWLITIVAAFFAIGCSIQDFDYWLLLALVPIFVFWYLDAFYLSLERGMRNREQLFVNILKGKQKHGEVESTNKTLEEAIYCFKTFGTKKDKEQGYVNTSLLSALFSPSVWPVYAVLIAVDIIITGVVNDWFSSICNCCNC